MEAGARMTSKGRVAVPKSVRYALGLSGGDEVVFRVEGNRAILSRTPSFLGLAGTFSAPAARRTLRATPS